MRRRCAAPARARRPACPSRSASRRKPSACSDGRCTSSQATWSSPLTNRLLLEAGFGGTYFGVGNFEREPNPTRDLIRVAEQCASGCAANGNIPGLVYRSQDFSVAHTGSYLWKGSLSYVTGSAQPEGRLSAHADDRRSDVDDERPEPDLPRSTTACRIS